MLDRYKSRTLIRTATLSAALILGLIWGITNLDSAPTGAVRADEENRADLVVRFSAERVITRQVTFAEDSISGYELLERSGLDIEASQSGMGVAVCRIEDVGCPSSNCFCQSPPDNWSYWHLEDGEWVYSPVGSDSYQISDGDIDGWSWGEADPPPPISEIALDEETATPSPTLTPTNTTLPTATASSIPTETPSPSNTPDPTATPTARATDMPITPEDSARSTQQDDSYPDITPEPPPDSSSHDAYPDADPTATEAESIPTDEGIKATATNTPRPTRTATSGVDDERELTDTPPSMNSDETAIQPTLTPPDGAAGKEVTSTAGETPTAEETVAETGLEVSDASATPDEIAALIATSVALDEAEKQDAVSGAVKEEENKGYTGFFIIVGILLLLIIYVALLQRQRRLDAMKASKDESET